LAEKDRVNSLVKPETIPRKIRRRSTTHKTHRHPHEGQRKEEGVVKEAEGLAENSFPPCVPALAPTKKHFTSFLEEKKVST